MLKQWRGPVNALDCRSSTSHLSSVLFVNKHLPVSTNFVYTDWSLMRLISMNSSGPAGLNGGKQGAIGLGLKDLGLPM